MLRWVQSVLGWVFSQSHTFPVKRINHESYFFSPQGYSTLKSKPFKYLCSAPDSSRVILVPGFLCDLHVRECSALSLFTLCINWRSAPVVTIQITVEESFDVYTHSVLFHAVFLGARSGAVDWGTALQAGRSRVRFWVDPLNFLLT